MLALPSTWEKYSLLNCTLDVCSRDTNNDLVLWKLACCKGFLCKALYLQILCEPALSNSQDSVTLFTSVSCSGSSIVHYKRH